MTDLEPEALAGAWKYLCVNVLFQGVHMAEAESKLCKPGSRWKVNGQGGIDKELIHQKAEAREWIEGGRGLITFEDCCEAMGFEPEKARQKILEYCQSRKRKPLKKPVVQDIGTDAHVDPE
jgi:hypothetical protein